MRNRTQNSEVRDLKTENGKLKIEDGGKGKKSVRNPLWPL
jgi:hypothetical protein